MDRKIQDPVKEPPINAEMKHNDTPKARYSPPERERTLTALRASGVDVLIVGAGINGAVTSAALASAGASVAVLDRGDIAGGVSSHSSNLAWGGIKYLESGELRLVRKLCLSRNRLMDAYPSTVREIRFFTSIRRGFRFWAVFVWLGALLYWLMGNCRMQVPRYLTRSRIEREAPEIAADEVVGGLEYSDCYLYDNDSRFVFNFIRQAMDSNAVVANYVEVEGLTWNESTARWQVHCRDRVSNATLSFDVKSLINCAGPDADLLNESSGIATDHRHVLSKGIHLIVDRVTELRKVLTFFASDGRLFFVIPMGPKTCIGTTDTPVGTPGVHVTDEDREFVLANANAMLNLEKPLTTDDIIAERVGVRPLAIAGVQQNQDWVQLSRKHEIEVDRERRYISVFGGKLTDCLNVGDEMVAQLEALGISMTASRPVWFGEPGEAERQAFMLHAAEAELDRLTSAHVPEPLSRRFWRRYGMAAFSLVDAIKADPREAELVLAEAEYTRAELRLVAQREMVVELGDFMRRRSKIEQVVRRSKLIADPGLREVSEILFGAQADALLDAYICESARKLPA
jgi:glycerol-3-phosphate dehydrogenase